MQTYSNRHGDSGVVELKIRPDFIIIRFDNSNLYVYESERIGRHHLDQMKRLAVTGKGLSTYITQNREVWNGWVPYDPAIHGDLD